MRERRVLHLIETDGLYGAERVVLSLSRQSQADGTFSPVIGCITSATTCELADQGALLGVDTRVYPFHARRAPWDSLSLLNRARAAKPDIIHTHGYKAAILGFTLSRLIGAPVLATCHLWFAASDAPLVYRVLTNLERRLYRRFGHVVGVSAAIADVIRQAGVSPSRISCIANGIDLPSEPCVVDASRTGDDAERPLRLVTVGRLVEQKAQHDLISAVGQLRSQGVHCQLALVGDGPLRASLLARAQRLGVDDLVSFLGFRRDVGSVLAKADVFALPSEDEGLPMALLEAMARGLPVIATPVGAVPTVLAHEENGLLFPVHSPGHLAAAIAGPLSSPAERSRLGRAARETVQARFSSSVMFGKYRAVYDGLLGRSD